MSTDLKKLAKGLKEKAESLGIKLSHSHSLELLSYLHGFKDYNSFSAGLKKKTKDDLFDDKTLVCLELFNEIVSQEILRPRELRQFKQEYSLDDNFFDNLGDFVDNKKNLYLTGVHKQKFDEILKTKLKIFEFSTRMDDKSQIDDYSYWIAAESIVDAKKYMDASRNDWDLEGEIVFIKELTYEELIQKEMYFEDSGDIRLEKCNLMIESFFVQAVVLKQKAPFLAGQTVW